jgi:hypothetical protein
VTAEQDARPALNDSVEPTALSKAGLPPTVPDVSVGGSPRTGFPRDRGLWFGLSHNAYSIGVLSVTSLHQIDDLRAEDNRHRDSVALLRVRLYRRGIRIQQATDFRAQQAARTERRAHAGSTRH